VRKRSREKVPIYIWATEERSSNQREPLAQQSTVIIRLSKVLSTGTSKEFPISVARYGLPVPSSANPCGFAFVSVPRRSSLPAESSRFTSRLCFPRLDQPSQNRWRAAVKLWYTSTVPTIVLDTHRLISSLKEHGFTEDQAAGITEAVQQIDLSQLATKADVREVEMTLKELELRMTVKLGSLVVAGTAFLAVLKIFA